MAGEELGTRSGNLKLKRCIHSVQNPTTLMDCGDEVKAPPFIITHDKPSLAELTYAFGPQGLSAHLVCQSHAFRNHREPASGEAGTR